MSWSEKWLQTQINVYTDKEHPRYEAYVDLLTSMLQAICSTVAPLSTVQARPKSPASFAEKCIRKSHKYNKPVEQLTDLCGGRIITNTLEEADLVCQLIWEHFIIDENNSEDVISRLRSDQFGYRSVHFVVQVDEDKLLALVPDADLSLLEQVNGVSTSGGQAMMRKAEIQVRTHLQHAWSDVLHDRLYKTSLTLPKQYTREASRLAATLEAADLSFGSVIGKVDAYETDYGAYMDIPTRKRELRTLSALLNVPDLAGKAELALRYARIARTLGRWADLLKVTKPYLDTSTVEQNALRLLFGYALCRQNEKTPGGKDFKRGQTWLKKVAQCSDIDNPDCQGCLDRSPLRARALSCLAWSVAKSQENLMLAHSLYRKAHECDPASPYHFVRFLEFEAIVRHNTEFVSLLRNEIADAMCLCDEHASVGTEIPRAHYTVGKLLLLSGDVSSALLSYCKAVALSADTYEMKEELELINDLIGALTSPMPGLAQAQRLLELAIASRRMMHGTSKQASAAVSGLAKDAQRLFEEDPSNAVIFAGSTSMARASFSSIVDSALDGYEGLVISGGTKKGICEAVGKATASFRRSGQKSFRAVGYRPEHLHADCEVDKRYDDQVSIPTTDFSEWEPLQYWTDILASGLRPDQVRVLGCGGGSVSLFEYSLALCLGSIVGLVNDFGGVADELLDQDPWWPDGNLLTLSHDPMTARAFLFVSQRPEERKELEGAARNVHEDYVASQKITNESTKSWSTLNSDLRRSCFHQIAYAENILKSVGYGIRKRRKSSKTPISLVRVVGKKGIRELAEQEHGRWNVERLMQGWEYATVKDVANKKSPYIVPWRNLSEKIKQYDVDAIRDLPKHLWAVDLEIYRLP